MLTSTTGYLGRVFRFAIICSFLLTTTLFLATCGGGGGGGGSPSLAPTITSVSVTCNPASVQTGQTSQCTATVTGTGSYSSAVTWSASAGTINSSGLLTAPSTAGTVTVTATSTQDATKSGTATVTITAPAVAVSVSPASATVLIGAAQQFTATVTGAVNTAVTWSVNDVTGGNATVGTISSAGGYTAPDSAPTPNTVTVKATSVADTTKFAAATVTISSAVSITALSATSAQPLSLITITGSVFDPAADILVRFFDGDHYSVIVPPVDASSTSLTVSVPPFIDATNNILTSGNVSVEVTLTSTAGTFTSNSIAGFQIEDLPAPSGTPGAITLDFLTGAQNEASTLLGAIHGTPFDTPDLNAALTNQISNFNVLLPQVTAVVQDPSQQFALGTLSGNSVTVGTSDLLKVDRMILGMLAAQATMGAAAPSGAILHSSASGAFTQSSVGCMSQEASDYANALLHPDGTSTARTAYFNSPANCTAAAFNTAYKVALGAGGVGIGIVAVVALYFGTPEAIAAAVALAAAELLYVTLVGSAGEAAVGALLAQTTDAGVALINDGIARLEELKYVALKPALGAAGGALLGMFFGAKALIEAFDTAIPRLPIEYGSYSITGYGSVTASPCSTAASWGGANIDTFYVTPGMTLDYIEANQCAALRASCGVHGPTCTGSCTLQVQSSAQFTVTASWTAVCQGVTFHTYNDSTYVRTTTMP